MQIGLVGSGRTGAHISRRLMRAGHPSVDIGPSGRVWGPARLYRLMIGADADAVSRLDPRFAVPADVPAASLCTRVRCRRRHTVPEAVLSAMRFAAGGHVEPVKT